MDLPLKINCVVCVCREFSQRMEQREAGFEFVVKLCSPIQVTKSIYIALKYLQK